MNGKVLAGAVALAILVPTAVFAAATEEGTTAPAATEARMMDEAAHQKVRDIRDQLKAGTITQEEAEAKLKELGLDANVLMHRGKGHHMMGFLQGLDEEAQTKAKDILKQVKDGTLAADEAKEKLKELGVSSDVLDKLHLMSDEIHQKVHEIRTQLHEGTITQEEAEAKLKELGIDASVLQHRGAKHHMGHFLQGLDEETRAKVKSIMDEVKNGTLTMEEAKVKLKELGVEMPERRSAAQ